MAANLRSVCGPLRALACCLSLGLVATGAFAVPGDVDLTFGNGGRVFISADTYSVVAASLVLQSDGKMLIGRATNLMVPTNVNLTVIRLNPDGTPDAAFGASGTASINLPGITASTQMVVIQGSGKIIVAGPASRADNPGGQYFAVARYQTDGTLDPTFGAGGYVLEDYNTAQAVINALLVQPDDRLVAVGSALGAGGKTNMAFTRFNADGLIDTTLGTNGHLIVDFSGDGRNSTAHSLARRADGGLIIAGTNGNSTVEDPSVLHSVLLALTADGAVDSSFGIGGRATPDFAGEKAYSDPQLGIQSNGEIVMSEVATHDNGTCELLVTRMDERGQMDPAFGTSGFASLPLGDCDVAVNVFVAPDDHILIGRASVYSGWDGSYCPCAILVTRLTEDGSRDVAFGVDGTASVDVGVNDSLSNLEFFRAPLLAQLTHGQIVVAGTEENDHEGSVGPGTLSTTYSTAVARLLKDGASPGLIGFKLQGGTIPWSQPSATLYVQRTGGSAGAVSVTFKTRDVTYPSGPDYSSASGTLNWPDGDTSDKPITVATANNSMAAGTESLEVTLSNPTGGTFLATRLSRIDIEHEPVPVSPTPISPTQVSPPAPDPFLSSPSGGGGGAVGWAQLLTLAIMLIGSRRRDRIGSAMVIQERILAERFRLTFSRLG